MKSRLLGRETDRLLDQLDGVGVIPALVPHHAEELQSLRMQGLGCQDLAIGGLRGLEPPGLMLGHGLVENGSRRCSRWGRSAGSFG